MSGERIPNICPGRFAAINFDHTEIDRQRMLREKALREQSLHTAMEKVIDDQIEVASLLNSERK